MEKEENKGNMKVYRALFLHSGFSYLYNLLLNDNTVYIVAFLSYLIYYLMIMLCVKHFRLHKSLTCMRKSASTLG